MKSCIRLAILASSAVATANALAAPTVFGLEIGTATITDLENRYAATDAGANTCTGQPTRRVSPDELGVPDLHDAVFAFDERDTLVAVVMRMPKSRFTYYSDLLSEKYELVSLAAPRVGNRLGVWRDADTEIRLEGPHLGFDMSLVYARRHLIDRCEAQSAAQAAAARDRDADQF